MGNHQHPILLELTPEAIHTWHKLQDKGHYELWRNNNTHLCFQAYYIEQSRTNNHEQLEKYQFRKIHNSYLVSVEFVVKNNDSFLCTQQRNHFVLIENIVSRLSSFQRAFTFEEALYILTCCSSGFNTINSLFGSLQPQADLICFNDRGKVKVWLNEDLSRNQPDPMQRTMNEKLIMNEDLSIAKKRNKEYVIKLLRLVESASVNDFPSKFKEESREVSTFFQLQNYIYYFCENNRIRMLENINLRAHNAQESNRKEPLTKSHINVPRLYEGGARELHHSNHQTANNHYLETSRVKHVFKSNSHVDTLSPLHNNIVPPILKMQPTFVPIKRQEQRISLQIPPTHHQQSVFAKQRMSTSSVPSITFKIGASPRNTEYTIIHHQPLIIPAAVQKTEVKMQLECEQLPEVQSNTNRKFSLIEMLSNSQHNIQSNSLNNQIQPFNPTRDIPLYQMQEVHLVGQQSQMTVQRIEKSSSGIVEVEVQHEEQPSEYSQEPYRKDSRQQSQREMAQQNSQQQIEDHVYTYESLMVKYESQLNQMKQQQQETISAQQSLPYHLSQFKESKSLFQSDKYSHIEPYQPNHYLHHQPIQEKYEDEHSPQKQSELFEWESKLNNFTLSQSKSKAVRPHPQHREVIQVKKIRQTIQQVKMIEAPAYKENGKELANLQMDDIQTYIRMKYQIYQQQSHTENGERSGKEYKYETKDYQSKYKQSDDYNSNNNINNHHSQEDNYQRKESTPFNKENYPHQPETYNTDNNHISITTHHAYHYKDAIEEDSAEHISSKKAYERNRNRNNKLSSFDQKYNKYVGKGQKPSFGRTSFKKQDMNASKERDSKQHKGYQQRLQEKMDKGKVSRDVSMILNNEESHVSKMTKQSRLNNEPSVLKGRQLTKQLSYKNLRSFLWAQ